MGRRAPSYERLCDRAVLRFAFSRVKLNAGCPGADGITVDDFARVQENEIERLSCELREETYRPSPLLRIVCPEGKKERPLSVPCVRDRVVHRAVAHLLKPVLEPRLSNASWAFRAGRGAMEAAEKVHSLLAGSLKTVLVADIERFFERIDHGLMMAKLTDQVSDERLVGLIHHLLRARVFDRMSLSESVVGLPQGSPLSPLLSNVYLDEFDRAVLEQGFAMIRYCDDFVVTCEDRAAADGALALCTERLAQLRQGVHPEKTRIVAPGEPFVFLGFNFADSEIGPSSGAIHALEDNLADIAARAHSSPDALDAALRGWLNYYGRLPIENLLRTNEGMLSLLRRGIPVPEEARRPTVKRERRAPWLHLALAKELAITGWLEESWGHLLAVAPENVADGSALADVAAAMKLGPEGAALLAQCHRGALSDDGGRERASETLRSAGCTDLGDALLRCEPGRAASGPDVPRKKTLLSDEAMHRFLALFSGLEDRHALEVFDHRGQRQFIPVLEPLAMDHLREHLAGRRTLGAYVFRSNGSVRFVVLDVDVKSECLKTAGADADKHLLEANAFAVRLCRQARNMGFHPVLEDSGYKGRHVWLFFQEAVPPAWARRLAEKILALSGAIPESLRCEIFPDRDRIRSGQTSPLIKLPLGVHGRSGRRCRFLDDDGNPLKEADRVLFAIATIPRPTLDRLVRDWSFQPTLGEKMPENLTGGRHAAANRAKPAQIEFDPPWAAEDEDSMRGLSSIIEVLRGCAVCRYLFRKARRTCYLGHHERLVLLNTLGAIGNEGASALHRIMVFTVNYDTAITQRWYDSRGPNAMSCGRLRERFASLTANLSCDCTFRLSKGTYPSPILHAVQCSPPKTAGAKKRRMIEWPRKVGRPKQIGSADDVPAAPVRAREKAAVQGDPSPAAAYVTTTKKPGVRSSDQQIQDAVVEIARLRRERDRAEKEFQGALGALDSLMESLGADKVTFPSGTLVRDPSRGENRFFIEI